MKKNAMSRVNKMTVVEWNNADVSLRLYTTTNSGKWYLEIRGVGMYYDGDYEIESRLEYETFAYLFRMIREGHEEHAVVIVFLAKEKARARRNASRNNTARNRSTAENRA